MTTTEALNVPREVKRRLATLHGLRMAEITADWLDRENPLLLTSEVAGMLGYASPSTLTRYAQVNRIPGVRQSGRQWMFHWRDVVAFAENGRDPRGRPRG